MKGSATSATIASKQQPAAPQVKLDEAPEHLQAHLEAHRICPGCGLELVDRGCKMRCLRCGFFLDCSDG